MWHQAAEFCPKARLRKVVRFRLDPFEYVDYLDLSILKWKIVEGDGRWWEDGDFDASLRDIGRNESGKVTCFQDILQWLQQFLQAKKPQLWLNFSSLSDFPTLIFTYLYLIYLIYVIYFHLSIEIQSFTFFLDAPQPHRGFYDSTLGGFEGIFTDGTYGYLYGGGTSGGFGGCGILIWLWKRGNCNSDIAGYVGTH